MEKKDIYEAFATKALQYLENTEIFLKEQIPDYFQQVITYHAISAWETVGLTIFGAFVCYRLFMKGMKMKDKYDNLEDGAILLATFSCLFGLLFLIGFFINLQTGLKATLAPKVFIVDYLRGNE